MVILIRIILRYVKKLFFVQTSVLFSSTTPLIKSDIFAEIFLCAVVTHYVISCILQLSSKQAWPYELSLSPFYCYCFFYCSTSFTPALLNKLH